MMKKALGAIPEFPRWPSFAVPPDTPNAPSAPSAPSMGPPGTPAESGASANVTMKRPDGEGEVPGGAHLFPDKVMQGIMAAISGRIQTDAGSVAQISRMLREFPIDQYRDADGNFRCPISEERRRQLMATFDD